MRAPPWAAALAGLCLAGCAAATAPPPGSATPALSAPTAPAPQRFVSPYAYSWFVRAELLAARGDHPRAIEAYRRVLAGDEDDPYVLARLALSLQAAGQPERADATIASALARAPHSPWAWHARAQIAEQRGQLEQAMVGYTDAARAAPDWPEPVARLAALLREQGHAPRGIAVLRQWAADDPQLQARAAQAQLELALLQGDALRAAQAARTLLDNAPGEVESVLRTAEQLVQRDRAELALPLLRALPASLVPPPLWLSARMAAGDRAGAVQLLRGTDPAALGGPLGVAEAYLELDEPALAQDWLADVSAEARDARYRWLAGQAALDLGQCADAAEHFSQVPAGSRYSAPALAGLRQALQCAALAAPPQSATRGGPAISTRRTDPECARRELRRSCTAS